MRITVAKISLQVERDPANALAPAVVKIESLDYNNRPVELDEHDWPFVRAALDEIFRREQERRDRCRPA